MIVSTPDPDHPPPFKVTNAIFCEEVRSELGGKHTILGASAGTLNLPTAGLIRVSAFIVIEPGKLGEQMLKLDISFAGKPVASAEIELEVNALDEPAVIPLPSFPLPILENGVFAIDVTIDGYRQRALSNPIRIAELKLEPSPET